MGEKTSGIWRALFLFYIRRYRWQGSVGNADPVSIMMTFSATSRLFAVSIAVAASIADFRAI